MGATLRYSMRVFDWFFFWLTDPHAQIDIMQLFFSRTEETRHGGQRGQQLQFFPKTLNPQTSQFAVQSKSKLSLQIRFIEFLNILWLVTFCQRTHNAYFLSKLL